MAAAATAASTALPPCRNTSMATRVASMSTVDAAPPRPTATGALVTGGVACAGKPFTRVPARAATISTDNAVVRRTIITPPSVRHYDQSPDEYTPVSRAQGRVSVPATIIRTPSRGRKVTSAPGVSKRGGGTAIYPRPHIPGYETSRR